jgi:hypothetical protein
MREHKLRSDINWQKTLKQKGINQMGIKQGIGVLVNLCLEQTLQETSS